MHATPQGALRAGARVIFLAALCGVAAAAGCMPPSWGAQALLHPVRRAPPAAAPAGAEPVSLDVGVTLRGWLFRAPGAPRGTIVYLHGLADNRASGVGIARRFTARGFDVLAYDSRAHGESGGDDCTYGFYEKWDVSRMIDRVAHGPVFLIGSSLGAGIALQAAAGDTRIAGVVAVAPIADLRTAVFERAPFFASRGNIEEALRIAEERGRFRVVEVSPVASAALIRAPVLLFHGAKDDETPPAHSWRVYQALAGPKRIVMVPGAHHNDTMRVAGWAEVEAWLDAQLAAARAPPAAHAPL